MKRNASTDDAVGTGYNFFSHCPLFMILDPPHLVKKLLLKRAFLCHRRSSGNRNRGNRGSSGRRQCGQYRR